jgi:hypothetical protein
MTKRNGFTLEINRALRSWNRFLPLKLSSELSFDPFGPIHQPPKADNAIIGSSSALIFGGQHKID